MVRGKIKVLVVDDSIVFREAIIRGIKQDRQIEVVAGAEDPFAARDKIIEFEPDVMICDVEMPKMNGIEFIRRLLPQYPLPVIVISGRSNAVFEAMDAGAVDFIAKPEEKTSAAMQLFFLEMVTKIKMAAAAKVVEQRGISGDGIPADLEFPSGKIIAMGASTGGTEALYQILKQLPVGIPGIVITQHIPPVFSGMFARRLDAQTSLEVKEAESGDVIRKGRVLLAPGDRHMRIRRAKEGYITEVFEAEKINGHCPSIDVLFDSVAREAGKNAVGIILTGMGYDGARGLLSMRRKGARTIGQDEKTSVVYGMPKVACDTGAVERQAALEAIPGVLADMLLE